MKVDIVYEKGNRFLDVHFEDDEEFRVQATNETIRPDGAGNRERESTTWNFFHPTTREEYRVQVQVTKPRKKD